MNTAKAIVSLFLGTVLAASGADNLIPNPGLELSPSSGLPIGWGLSRGAAGEVVDASGGKKALRLMQPEEGKDCYWRHILKNIEPGKIYELKGRIRADEGTLTRVYVECTGPWKTVASDWRKGTGEWQDFRLKDITFQEVQAGSYIYVICALKNAGTADFAELELTETDPDCVNLIRNADFFELKADGTPKFWSLSKGAQAMVVPDAGDRILKLKNLPESKESNFIQHGIELRPDVDYQLTLHVKGVVGTRFRAFLESPPPPMYQTQVTNWLTCSDEWQEVSFRFHFSEFKNKPYLGLRVNGQGEVQIRHLKLEETPGVLRNGRFIDGLKHWQVKNGTITSRDSDGMKALELNSGNGPASARQSGIRIVKDRFYELRYSVRGGSDKAHRDSQNAVWFRAMPVMNGKMLGSAVWLDSFDNWQRKTVVFQAPADGKIDILLEAKEPYCVDFAKIELEEVKNAIPPLVLLADGPFAFRNGVYTSNRQTKKAKFTIVYNTLPETAFYQVCFNNSVFELKNAERVSFEMDVPQKPGIYPVEVTAKDAAGKTLGAVSLPFQVNPPAPREITFREDHVMLIDGKPFFPLGVWGIAGKESNEEKAKIISECGFNLALAHPDTIDAFAEQGMMAFLHVPAKLPNFRDSAHFKRWDTQYRKVMARHAAHPSLIGYFNIDEPAWNGVPVEGIQDAYEYIRKVDPYRPVMLNEAPRGSISEIRPYSLACDIYGVDIYPVPEPNAHSGLEDKNMTSVGKYTERCREVVYNRKPVWMTLQAFAWGDLTNNTPVLPTTHQSRFMAYNAIVHGATGLFWWGFNYSKSGVKRWDFIRELGSVIHELRSMSPVFTGETVISDALETSNPEIRVLRKKADGKTWYIAVNESNRDTEAEFHNAGTEVLHVFFENRSVTPKEGRFQDTFKAYDVHIYSDAEALPPPLEIPATHRMTPMENIPEDYRKANWIWYPGKSRVKDHRAYFKSEFILNEIPEKALILATADDWFRMYINGRLFMEHYKNNRGWNNISYRDAAPFLKPDKNTIFIKALDGGGAPCGMLFSATIQGKDGKKLTIQSDAETTMVSEDGVNWVKPELVSPFGGAVWTPMGDPCPADTELLDAFGFPF